MTEHFDWLPELDKLCEQVSQYPGFKSSGFPHMDVKSL